MVSASRKRRLSRSRCRCGVAIPFCGFLLEHVEHIQDALKAHGIDGAVGVAIEVVANLDNSTAEAFEWLRVGGMVAELNFEKRLADFAPDFYWEFPRSFRL